MTIPNQIKKMKMKINTCQKLRIITDNASSSEKRKWNPSEKNDNNGWQYFVKK